MEELEEELYLKEQDSGKSYKIKKNGFVTLELNRKSIDQIWRHDLDGNYHYSKSIKVINEEEAVIIYITQILKEDSVLKFTLCNKLDLCKTIYKELFFNIKT